MKVMSNALAEPWILEEDFGFLISSGVYAVRPNLNKKGVLTIHETGKKGRPDYSHAYYHTWPHNYVVLSSPYFHVSSLSVQRIRKGEKSKHPCAAVGGVIERIGDYLTNDDIRGMEEILFSPILHDYFVDLNGGKVKLNGSDEVLLWQKRCWVRRNHD